MTMECNAEGRNHPDREMRIRLSLPEIDAICFKAARGAGYSWGMAEEASFAARWLAARGLPGPEILLAHLHQFDGKAWDEIAPLVGEVWCGRGGGILCALAAGSALSDRAGLPGNSGAEPFRIENLARPMLILPFVHQVAKAQGVDLSVRWGQSEAILSANGWRIDAEETVAGRPETAAVEICKVDRPGKAGALSADSLIENATLRGLLAFAHRTYVPATDQSRAGAGAASSDND